MNQTWKIDFQKRFPVIQIDSTCRAAICCRGQAWTWNSESVHVDWKRKKTFHYNLIPHLEILQNQSQNSSVLASLATEKWAFVLSHVFS